MSGAQPAADGAATTRPRREQSWDERAWSIGKNVLLFVGVQFAFRQFLGGGNKATPAPPSQSTPGDVLDSMAHYSAVPDIVYPLWPTNSTIDISIYVSPSIAMPPFHAMPAQSLILNEKSFALDRSKKDHREIASTISVPRSVQDNGTLWAHIFVGRSGAILDPASSAYDSSKAYRMTRPLTQYLAKRKVRKSRNLLESRNTTMTETELEEEKGALIASYYHPNFTLSFVPETGAVGWPSMHPATKQFYILDASNARDSTGKNAWYYPVLYLNTFWQLKSHMTELNLTHPIDTLPVNIALSTLAPWQFQVMAAMDEGMKETARRAAHGQTTAGGGDGSEMELIKETLLDTNPWLLGTTAIVSMLHMVFELLAFKNDVGHWRKKKDNVGVSVRTILSNVVMQTIIFLYLMDNNENTSWMILFGQGMGIAVEAWKITKTVNVRVREPQAGSFWHGILPMVVVFEDKHKLSETEEKTEEYDKIAFKYMGILAVPLLLAYAAYSLYYESHRSWYSFVITTLVGSVYAYGFLMMVPSLYINYRLRSVAHMSSRAMAYKFLNTFIDDLFAFTIKMPLLHRLATLRDDIIFFVYLYQAWAYKVDFTRVNEFGQGGDDEELEAKTASKPLTAPTDADTSASDKQKGMQEAEAETSGSAAPSKGSAKKRRG